MPWGNWTVQCPCRKDAAPPGVAGVVSFGGQRIDPPRATLVAMRPHALLRAALPPLVAAVLLTAVPSPVGAGPPRAEALDPVADATTGLSAVAGPVSGPATAARADVGRPTVRSRTVEFGATGRPAPFTIACAPGEQLLSGGYVRDQQSGGTAPFPSDNQLRVISSFPSDAQGLPVAGGGQATAWTVSLFSASRAVRTLRILVTCLVGGESTVGVYASRPSSGSRVPSAAECPAGTARTGGGYALQWQIRHGAVAVYGSYPAGARGWGVEVGTGPAGGSPTTVYVVCHTGPVTPVEVAPVVFELQAKSRECVPGIAAAACLLPRDGTGIGHCPAGAVLAGGGYRLEEPAAALLEYAVLADGPTGNREWNVRAVAFTTTAEPARMSLTPVCLAAAPAPDGPVSNLPNGDGGRRNMLLTLAAGLLGLLVLVLLAVLALRRSRRRDPAPPAVRIEVVVRATRAGHTEAYREDV